MSIHHILLKPIVHQALEQDRIHGEWATDICVPENTVATAEIICREDIMLACVELLQELFYAVANSPHVNVLHNNGERLQAGTVIASISGNGRAILKGERVALALLSHCCGIASAVAACVAQLDNCQLLANRSVGTDMQPLEQAAATTGGVCSHRLGLSDSIIVSAKHAALGGGIKHAVALLRESLSPTQKVAVEIDQLEQLQDACDAGADLVILHALEASEVAFAVRTIRNQTLTAATGDIPADMVAEYAATGVNFISSDTIVQTAKRAKLALNLMS